MRQLFHSTRLLFQHLLRSFFIKLDEILLRLGLTFIDIKECWIQETN
jgi:hypothetical protein